MLNELQQRYLSKEGEKYTFYPIINNYIIKYNRPYFPTLPNTDIYQEDPLTYKYLNNLNNSNKHKTSNINMQENNIPYNNTENNTKKSSKKSLINNNGYFISIEDNINKNKMLKKIDKYNLSNDAKKYKKRIIKNKNNDNSSLYENKNKCYNNNINGIKQDMKISNKGDNILEDKKIIQKTNSFKTFFTNKSKSKDVNQDINININNINNNKPKYKKKDLNLNNIIRISIPLEELKNFNFNSNSNLPLEKYNMNTNTNINKDYLNKIKDKNNNNNKSKIIEGLSLKHLIQDEKAKKIIKQNKSKNISKEKANKIIDNIFNNNNKSLKRTIINNNINNNNLKIDIEDYNLNLNENPNNIRIQSENYYTIKKPKEAKDNNLLTNKNIKTESNYKKININNKNKNRINIQKSFEKNINTNFRIITLTEKQKKQNKKYYNKNTFNKNINDSIIRENDDTLNVLKSNKLLYELYKPKEYNEMISYNKKSKNIKSNNINNIKKKINTEEKTIPVPKYNKINILNMISEPKRNMKNTIIDEKNNKTFLYNKFKYMKINDLNQTNEDINHTLLFKGEKRMNTFTNNNTQTVDEEKNFFSLNEPKYDYNKFIKIKNKKKENEQINKINSFEIGQKYNNNLKNKNNYIISSHEINEYYSNFGRNIGNNANGIDIDDKNNLSIQSLSDSKVLEIANTYVDEQVDKNKVCNILTYKKKKNQNSYYEK